MSTKSVKNIKTKNSSNTKAKPEKKKLTFKEQLHIITHSRAIRIAFNTACFVTSLAIIAIVLCVKVPAWQLKNSLKSYNKVMTDCINNSITPEVLVKNADIQSLSDEAVRDLLFGSQIFDAAQFDSELQNNESYKAYAKYTHVDIPLNYLLNMMAGSLAVNASTDVISFTDYIKNNIRHYDLTADSLVELLNNYCYNIMIVENMLEAHEYISFLYETLYADYAKIPDEELVTIHSPIEMRNVYEDFVVSDTIRAELEAVSSELHRILESYYYKYMNDYLTSPFGSASYDTLNLSFFSLEATSLYDLLYDYYLAATDYLISGTQYNLYISDSADTEKLQKVAERFSEKLGYNTVYYGIVIDEDTQFNIFENIGSAIAQRLRKKSENDELVRLVYQQLAGYNTLGERMPLEDTKMFSTEFVFWNMLFDKLNTEAEAMSPDYEIYLSANNYMNSTVVQIKTTPGDMIFNEGTTKDLIKNLCWARAIQTLYSTVVTTSGISVDSASQTTTIPNDLTEQQISALNMIYAWVNYAVRYATVY